MASTTKQETNKLANLLDSLYETANRQIFIKKLDSPLGYILFTLLGIGVAYLVVYSGDWKIAALIIAAPIGLAFAFVCLFNLRFSLFATFFASFFIFQAKRLTSDEIPYGVIVELMMGLTLVAFLLERIKNRDHSWSFATSPITYAYFIYFGYVLFQFFNPNVSSQMGWFQDMRRMIVYILVFMLTMYLFKDRSFLRVFVRFWLIMATTVALYACFQEFYGLLPFEEAWLRADRTRFRLTYVGGQMRKFSYMSGPTDLGIYMGINFVFCLVMAAGTSEKIKRIGYISLSVLFFAAMTFAGARTAYVMVVAGVLMFSLMTINNKTTLFLSVAFALILAVVLFGPFYGNPAINRLRTAFINPTEDASFVVRENNRAFIQPYMQSHPIGGGLGSCGTAGRRYNPGHELAGFPPDSGYMRVGMEMGWIGLLFAMGLFVIVLVVGIHNFYNIQDPKLKAYTGAFVVAVYSLAVAEFAQSAVGQVPLAFFIYPALAILAKIKQFDNQTEA